MDKKELERIRKDHLHWLWEDCPGWENMKANLREADLHEASLVGVVLSSANMRAADLRGADLRGSALMGTILGGANLCRADLSGADLSRADLSRTDAQKTALRGANLQDADLSGADLRGANLTGANLIGANLTGADLCGADLRNTKLTYADLTGAKLPDMPTACPETGAFTGYKKAGGYIVVLEIPEDAKRSSATGDKCRCDKALVVAIQNYDGTDAGIDEIPSDFDSGFIYRVNEMVSVPDFNENRWNECSTGIHFFANRERAVIYL